MSQPYLYLHTFLNLILKRNIHAKCQILLWNLVLVGCPLKTLNRCRPCRIFKRFGSKSGFSENSRNRLLLLYTIERRKMIMILTFVSLFSLPLPATYRKYFRVGFVFIEGSFDNFFFQFGFWARKEIRMRELQKKKTVTIDV